MEEACPITPQQVIETNIVVNGYKETVSTFNFYIKAKWDGNSSNVFIKDVIFELNAKNCFLTRDLLKKVISMYEKAGWDVVETRGIFKFSHKT